MKHHLEVTQQRQNRNPRGEQSHRTSAWAGARLCPAGLRLEQHFLGGWGVLILPPKSFTHLMLKSSISVMPSKQVAMERAKRAMPTKMCWGL